MIRAGVLRAASLVAAVVGLDLALTFAHVWPTFAIRPTAALSIEVLAVVTGILLLGALGRPPGKRVATALALVLTVMAVGRYAAVTTAGLYGRPVHLYFDLPHVPNVFAMLAKVASPWLLAGGAVVAVLILGCVLAGLRAALVRVTQAAARPGERAAVATVCAAAAALALPGDASPVGLRVAEPVTGMLVAQARRFGDAALAARRDALLPPPAELGDGPLAALDGRDVLVVFIESYGAVTFDRPDVRAALADSRAALERAITRSGRGVVSAFVESPTFAGASWLAHATFMTAGRIDNGGAYARLPGHPRDTVPKRFARAGYRTVAVMPGVREAWPEGAFLGFDAIYDAAALDYRGPEFGWWRIPDQYTLATLDRLERRAGQRAPLFAFVATLSTHVPFRPTPPYQDDWSRFADGGEPFDSHAVEQSLARRPDWLDLAPAYVDSVRYALETLAGYLEWRADDDFVLILLGDHQPAASITGPGARWDVPVHVIGPPALLEPLAGAGFVPGLAPSHDAVAEMHELAPRLLRAFASTPATRLSE
ncbi:MAG TPA: sulfatase-like hydrolase/transferase [Gammaproteobacteria bacterium]